VVITIGGIMGGIKAGIIVGIIAGLIGGVLQVANQIPVLNILSGIGTFVLQVGCFWFIIPIATGVCAVLLAKKDVQSLVDGALAGLVGGAIYAILTSIISLIAGWVMLIVVGLLSGALAGNIANGIVNIIVGSLLNFVGWVLGLVITFFAGLFWGAVGGAAYTALMLKPKAKELD
jgi:hypothetical protein